MRRRIFGLSTLVFGLLLAALPAVAHHSFSAEFDGNKKVTMKGIVTKIEWTNPHAWFYMNVKDETGKITNWGFELGPPHLLAGQGWTRTSMKIGDEIIVLGSLAKNGSNRVNAQNVTFAATGLKMGAGSSEGTTP